MDVPPVCAVYHTMDVPDGAVPLIVALMEAVLPAHTVAPVPLMVKFVTAWLAVPAAPFVAPLGGNSVRCAEFVVPFEPGLTVCVAEPPDVAI